MTHSSSRTIIMALTAFQWFVSSSYSWIMHTSIMSRRRPRSTTTTSSSRIMDIHVFIATKKKAPTYPNKRMACFMSSSLSDALGEIFDDELPTRRGSHDPTTSNTHQHKKGKHYKTKLHQSFSHPSQSTNHTMASPHKRNKAQIKKLKFLMNEDVEKLIQAANYTEAIHKAEENIQRLEDMYQKEKDNDCKYLYKPTTHNWNMLIRAHGKSNAKDAPLQAEQILNQLKRAYYTDSTTTCTDRGNSTVISTTTQDQNHLNILKPSVISYTEVIDSYAKSNLHNSAEKAETLLYEMLEQAEREDGTYDEDVAPTSITCDAVLNAWARRGTIEGAERAEQILERMEYIRTKGKRAKIQPTSYSFATVISAWAKAAKIGETQSGVRAQHILKRMMEFRKEILDQEGPDSEYAKLLKPDSVVYNSVLDAWARTRTPIAGTKADELLFEMEERIRMGDHDSSPDTITYNSVINCHASSGHINAAKAAERVLKKMEIASKTNPAVVPNTLTYNQVLKAYSTSKLPGGTNRADVILRYMMMSRNKNIEPDSFSFTTCLNIWAKSKEPGKAEKAYAILNKMLEAYRLTGKDQMRPNEITYNTVLNACAFSAYTPNEEKKKALSIAVSIFNEMHKSDIVQPDAVSYGNMLKCIANLVPKGEVRNKMAVDVFTKCRNLGLVNGLVFDEIRRAVPADVLTDLLSEAMKRRRGKKLFSEWELRDLPHSWKSKVHEMKPKKREPRKSKKDSSTTVAVEVAEGTNMNGTIRPMRTIVETSWQSGRDV